MMQRCARKLRDNLWLALKVAVILYIVLGAAVQTYDAWSDFEIRRDAGGPGRRIAPSGGPVR